MNEKINHYKPSEYKCTWHIYMFYKCVGLCSSLRKKQPKTVKFIVLFLVAVDTCWENHCHCPARWPEQCSSLFLLDSGGNSFVTSTESVSAPPRSCVWLPFHQCLPRGLCWRMEYQNGKLLCQLGFCHDLWENIGLSVICLLAFSQRLYICQQHQQTFPRVVLLVLASNLIELCSVFGKGIVHGIKTVAHRLLWKLCCEKFCNAFFWRYILSNEWWSNDVQTDYTIFSFLPLKSVSLSPAFLLRDSNDSKLIIIILPALWSHIYMLLQLDTGCIIV